MSDAVNDRAVHIQFSMSKTHVVPFDSDPDPDPDSEPFYAWPSKAGIRVAEANASESPPPTDQVLA